MIETLQNFRLISSIVSLKNTFFSYFSLVGSRYFSLLISFYYFDLSRLEEASVSMSRPLGTVRHVLRLDVISIVRPPNELGRFFLYFKRFKL